MKRVFVTGSTGFIGRHLIGKFRSRGHYLICLVRDIRKARQMTITLFQNAGAIGRLFDVRYTGKIVLYVFGWCSSTDVTSGLTYEDRESRFSSAFA